MRHDNRRVDELRPITVRRHFTRSTPGSVLIQAGRTTVLCTASIDETVPPWKQRDESPTGWVTAEYCMLPGSTSPRKRREREKVDSRSSEIQRLVGRSLRAVVEMAKLGERTVWLDCDVIQADGGTRTAAITGGFIALADAIASIKSQLIPGRPVLRQSVAAISVGVFDGEPIVDLDYLEDSKADVDMNVVMTGDGEFVEIQGTAEARPFNQALLDRQLSLAKSAIVQLTEIQRKTLGPEWPLDTSAANR
jgi:ribonuclease PH